MSVSAANKKTLTCSLDHRIAGKAILNRDIAAVHKANLFKSFFKTDYMRGVCLRPAMQNPITGSIGCCACGASGHAAAPPKSVINSRRRMSAPAV